MRTDGDPENSTAEAPRRRGGAGQREADSKEALTSTPPHSRTRAPQTALSVRFFMTWAYSFEWFDGCGVVRASLKSRSSTSPPPGGGGPKAHGRPRTHRVDTLPAAADRARTNIEIHSVKVQRETLAHVVLDDLSVCAANSSAARRRAIAA